MTLGDRRLDRLYPALSAKERAILILRAWKAGDDPEPQIRSTIPNNQVFAYDRLIALMRRASGDLTNVILVVVQLVEQLSLRWCWLASLHVAALNAEDVASVALAAVRGKERIALRRALRPRMARFAMSLCGDPRWGQADEVQRMSGDVIAAGLIAAMREIWPQRWQELRAVEIVLDEVAQEFDGEDPLDPEVRILLDTCRADLLDLKERIEPYTGKVKVDDPEEELLNRLRESVGDG